MEIGYRRTCKFGHRFRLGTCNVQRLGNLYFYCQRLAIPYQPKFYCFPNRRHSYFVAQIGRITHAAPINPGYDVTRLQTSLFRWRIGLHSADDGTFGRSQSQGSSQIVSDILTIRTQPPAAYFTKAHDLIHHCFDHDAWHRESNTDICAGWPDNGGIDTDQLSLEINQRTAGISRINGCVSLYEIFIAFDIKPASP